MIKDIGSHIDIMELDGLKERKDKLISRLFMKKLEIMLEDESLMFFSC